MSEKMGKYDDIINLPHHVSDYHKPMIMANRAAQFAPFAALCGYEEAIAEKIRLTEEFKYLSESEKNLLSRKLDYAIERNSLITITYFIPDNTKAGGSYKRISDRVKRLDEVENILITLENNKIPLYLISDIDIIDENIEF